MGMGIAGEAQAQAFQKNERTRVVAACTRNRERLAAAVRKFEIETAAESYEALLDTGIDIAVIAVPDHLHTEYVLKALEKGVHVLCEKPLATTVEDLRTIVRAARKAGKIFMTGQCARFFDRSQFARQLLDRGELGEIFFAESDYLHDLKDFLRGWRVDPKSPQDMVLGGGCHPLDLLRWYLGDVETVHGIANRKSLPPDCPIRLDCILLSLKFASGAIGKVLVSVGCKRPYSLGLSLYGTAGTLVDERFYLSRYSQFEDFMDAKLPKHSHDVNTIFERQAAHLVDCLDRGVQPMADVVEGAKTAATCIAGIMSIRDGKPVRVPSVSPDH
jgi:predicted dehydrogenase